MIPYLSPARRFVLGGELFPTKTSVLERCKKIRGPYKPGVPRRIVDPQEVAFLQDLLKLHPRSEKKRGVGIRGFRVAADSQMGVCFWVDRIDGTSTDFSFNECLSGGNRWADFRAAARKAVLDQVLDFKMKNLVYGETRCAASGALLEPGSTHVDHEAPRTFEVLLDEFLTETGLDWNSVRVSSGVDGSTVKEFLDSRLRESWSQFHRERAVLRLVTRTENLGGPSALRKPESSTQTFDPLPADWDYLFEPEDPPASNKVFAPLPVEWDYLFAPESEKKS